MYAKVDLTTGKWECFPINEELFSAYLGGKILAGRLLTDLTPAGLDPLCPEAVLNYQYRAHERHRGAQLQSIQFNV